MKQYLALLDGHRGVVLLDPISNSKVKRASVLVCTAFRGKSSKLSNFFFKDFSENMGKKVNIATYNITGAINSTNRFYSRIKRDKFQVKIEKARNNLEFIVNFVEEKEISILALQEVDVCYNGDERLYQAEFLADRLSMNYRYITHSNYSLPNGLRVTTGLALFTKFEILDSKVIDFSQERLSLLERMKKKYVGNKKSLLCNLDINGVILNVVSAHLTHNQDQQKEYELETLLKICQNNYPTLLMGDLNSTPLITRENLNDQDWFYKTDKAMNLLKLYSDNFQYDSRLGDFKLTSTGFNEIMTTPSEEPNKKIDYLFLFPKNNSFLLSQEEVLDLKISDHRPVLAQLTIDQ